MTEQSALHQAIRGTADPMTLMDRIVAQSLLLLPAADGASLEVRRDSGTLEYLCAAGTLAPYIGLRLPIDASMSGRAVLSGEVQLCHDALDDERVNREAVLTTGVRSMLCVPLTGESTGVAVLKVSSREPGSFTNDDADRLRIMGRFLGAAVGAASQVATVTAELLADLEHVNGESGSPDGFDSTAAQFVANVMTPGLVDRVEIASAVEEVIARGSFEIVLQPIVDLRTGRAWSCEALSRFNGRATRSTEWWFSAAHSVGLGPALEESTLRRALLCQQLLPESMRLSVNVGVDLLLQPGFLDVFGGVDCGRLTVELTEHEAVEDYGPVLEVMSELRDRGACLSVDDTGSGYSGLTHILRLCPDVIKLDRELVAGLHCEPAKSALASALVAFARSIDAHVVAEGVEHEAEADCLQSMGVDFGQGYLDARPMSAAHFIELLAQPGPLTDRSPKPLVL